MSPNGISFDISDDEQFKTFVVQKLTQLEERTATLTEIKARAERVLVLEQEMIDVKEDIRLTKKWNRYQASIGPVMVMIHATLHKFGIM